jgi:CheY-like chemotaxis protein
MNAKTVLLVDDEPDVLEITRKSLIKTGFGVHASKAPTNVSLGILLSPHQRTWARDKAP